MGRRVELEPTAVEVDGGFEVLLVPKAVRAFLDRLDLGVKPLTDGIGDGMGEVSQHIGQVALDQAGHLDHRGELRMRGPEVPALPEAASPAGARVAPQDPQGLLQRPGAAGLQVVLLQLDEARLVHLGQVLARIQPQVLGAGQRLVARSEERRVGKECRL